MPAPPPPEEFPRAAMAEEQQAESDDEADRNDPVPADQMLVPRARAHAATERQVERFGARIIRNPEPDVVGEDRFQQRENQKRRADDVADKQEQGREKSADAGQRDMSHGAEDGHDLAGADGFVDAAFERVGLRDALRRAERAQD